MSKFSLIKPEKFSNNIFSILSSEWGLLTSSKKDKNGDKIINTMTVSWGGAGVLWNKNVVFIFVRPNRYTEEIINNSDGFSLSFLMNESENQKIKDKNRDILKFCGSNSGRDCDKIKECGLTIIEDNNKIYFEESKIAILCKKLYKQQLTAESIIEKDLLKNYVKDEYHNMYIGEIEKILINTD